MILKGCIISDYAVIAAGAVVTKSIAKGEIWGGVPARKIGQRPDITFNYNCSYHRLFQ